MTAAEPKLPETIGPYRVQGELGAGGMGVVYRAVGADGSAVAVKVLRALDTGSREQRHARFMREAQVRLEHPNLVRIVDSGVTEADRVPWIAFELLEGKNLEQRLQSGTLPPREALDIARQAAAGLQHAHAAGVIHRDIKPTNLLLTRDGTLKILDFGVARLVGRETRITGTGQVLGTAAYLSPEQASGNDRIDGRADLWALGVVLYEILTGRNPFDRGSVLATVVAVLSETPPPVTYFDPRLADAVGSLVGRCLERRPDERWPNAGALASALEALLTGDGLWASGEPGGQAGALTSADTQRSPSIRPGEERLVAVVVGRNVSDAAAFRRTIEALGGVCLPHQGDRMVAVFGAQHWEGDEMKRAAQAALQVRAFCHAVAMASGRASGADMTTMAGAVLDAAEAGCALELDGVAIEQQSARTLSGYVLGEAADGFCELKAGDGTRPETESGARAAPLLGRDSELAQMRRALQRALTEARATGVLVVGSPGMGKSRLRDAMLQLLADEPADPPRIWGARATPLMRHRSYGLIRALLVGDEDGDERWDAVADTSPSVEGVDVTHSRVRALVRDALGEEQHTDDYVAFFGEVLGVPVPATDALRAARRDPRLMNDRIRGALIDWFVGVGMQGPLALVVDDIHWADDESLRLLIDVGQQLLDGPLLLFASSRPEMTEAVRELSEAIETHRLELRGLLASDVAELGRSLLGREPSSELVERIVDHAGGNPLFVEQILLALNDAEQLDQPVADLPIPLTVEAAIQSRLDHLPSHEKEVCKHAAILEDAFDEADVEELGPIGVREALEGLVRHEVLMRRRGPRASVRWDFRSRLVRDVSRRTLEPSLRRELHARRARMLASRADSEAQRIALHWEQAGEDRKAARAYASAVRRASRQADAPAVLHCAERALALGPEAEDLFGLYMGRSDALEALGDLQRQGEALEQALASAADEIERARALTDRAVWSLRSGDTANALAEAERAVQAARVANDDEIQAKALGRRGTILIYAGRLQDAESDLEAASQLVQQSVPHLAPLMATWQAQLATARGDHAARIEAFRRAAELYEQVGDVRRVAGSELNLADAYNRLGLYEEAAEALLDVVDKARRVGQTLWEGYAWLNRGYALLQLGRADDARGAIARAAELAERTGERRLGLFARLYELRAGAEHDARGGAADARALASDASELGQAPVAVLANALAASLELRGGDPSRALELSTRALRQLEHLGSLEEDEGEVYLTHGRVLEACGRSEEAAEVREQGAARVRAIAARIADESMRERFLRQVPAHRELT